MVEWDFKKYNYLYRLLVDFGGKFLKFMVDWVEFKRVLKEIQTILASFK